MITRRRSPGIFGALVFAAGCGLCLSSHGAEPRVLLVGDSWANAVRQWHALESSFKEAGMGDIGVAGETTTVSGSRADQWVTKEYQDKIAAALAGHPSIDTIHLIISLNDVIHRIRVVNVFEKWDEERRNSEWRTIAGDVRKIVEYCLSFPQVKHVALAGYDYMNAETARECLTARGHVFTLGGMTQAQVNACFIAVERLELELAKEIKGCAYVQNFGLAQHHFDEPKGAPAPGDPPDYSPFPGGNPDYPMPDKAFDPVVVGERSFPGDGIHPNKDSHKRMCLHAIDQCYRGWFAAK